MITKTSDLVMINKVIMLIIFLYLFKVGLYNRNLYLETFIVKIIVKEGYTNIFFFCKKISNSN